jgi:long-chain acyl-CoA synthetase
MVTGSAPIKAEVLDFLRLAFACPVIEGYGQTEYAPPYSRSPSFFLPNFPDARDIDPFIRCGAAATLSRVTDMTSGHVGGPMPCNEVRLCDVPEMNYLSSSVPPRGEVCFRGPNVFSGYYKAPEQTAEALDSEGWLHR